MKSSRVTVIAIGALVVVAAATYFVINRSAPGPAIAGVKTDDKASGAGDSKSSAPKAADKSGSGGPTPVEFIRLQPTVVKEELQAVGSLMSNESVTLRPEVPGRIASIGFRDGEIIRKGQTLVLLDAALNEAEVAQAKAEYDLALSNFRRSEDLASRQFISSSAKETAASNLQVAEARLKLAQARLSKMKIVAPFDGVAGMRTVSPGDYVKDGADLVNLEDVRTLKVDFRLPERNLSQVRVGQKVEVVADALPRERWQGVVEAINPRVDANGRSLELRARLPNTGGLLRPGMFVRVRVVIGERATALLVPEEAIVPQGEEFHLYKIVDGKARRVPVQIGVRRNALVEVIGDVAPGDQVVTAGIRIFADGQAVKGTERVEKAVAETASNADPSKSVK
ncbi:MAG: efflux RND transporter periplasmic adaptor subunit [Burkholderiaceae bacterium]